MKNITLKDLQNSIFLKEELNSKKYNRKSICDDFE